MGEGGSGFLLFYIGVFLRVVFCWYFRDFVRFIGRMVRSDMFYSEFCESGFLICRVFGGFLR